MMGRGSSASWRVMLNVSLLTQLLPFLDPMCASAEWPGGFQIQKVELTTFGQTNQCSVFAFTWLLMAEDSTFKIVLETLQPFLTQVADSS